MSGTVPTEVWISDVSDLMLALMYGNPPGGWSDPDRRKQFQDRLVDIEARLRAAVSREKLYNTTTRITVSDDAIYDMFKKETNEDHTKQS